MIWNYSQFVTNLHAKNEEKSRFCTLLKLDTSKACTLGDALFMCVYVCMFDSALFQWLFESDSTTNIKIQGYINTQLRPPNSRGNVTQSV